jgi:hypothetical protein
MDNIQSCSDTTQPHVLFSFNFSYINSDNQTDIRYWSQIGNMLSVKTNIEPLKVGHGDIILYFLGTLFRGDVNTIIDIYKEYGIEYLMKTLDGNYVFFLIDQQAIYDEARVYIVNDPMNSRPIYANKNGSIYSTIPLPGTSLQSRHQSLFYRRLYLVNQIWNRVEHYHPQYSLYSKPPLLTYPFIELTRHMFDDIVNFYFSNNMEKWIKYGWKSDTKKKVIMCVIDETDTESFMIYDYLRSSTHSDIDIVKAQTLCENIPDIETTQYRIFMSSGIIKMEKEIKRKATTVMQYDCEFHRVLTTWSAEYLLPLYYEPYQECGLTVEFPYMDYTWLSTYLSILPEQRYNKT